MLISDLIHSCSNERIALAAMASIGGVFAERVRGAAQENGVPAGRYIARIVQDFGCRANVDARHALQKKVKGADQPLLSGLQHIIETAIESGALVYFDEESECMGSFSSKSSWIRLRETPFL
jgi:hypothetical protein